MMGARYIFLFFMVLYSPVICYNKIYTIDYYMRGKNMLATLRMEIACILILVFIAFSQVDQKKNHSKEGTGLGLSISRDFIHLMGGELSVASVYGEGNEFFFTIYQKKAACDAVSLDEKTRVIESVVFTAEAARVLLVDDNAINIKVESKLLADSRVRIDTAGSGVAALEPVKSNTYNIIFMDYMMPYMDGVETAEKIRAYALEEMGVERAEYYRNVPIIALTGDNLEKSES